ncbi:MAG: bifunctional 4-hydroxy-2-oxoglutarate aldolase/2-dehydro-3-deoxy-phosphogluconate aldolase [Herpetosiphon sp.]
MEALQQILSHKIVAIVRLNDYTHALEVARALCDGGITTLEFTLTGQGAVEAVTVVRKELGDGACVGIGSVLRRGDALHAIDAGAQFVVTPAVRHEVITACINRNIPILAGGFTPTELLDAYEAGAPLVKLFPAQHGGPRYVQDVLAPMPFLKLVPTGGVSADNARAYLAAGAVALGIGGNLVSNKLVASGAFDQITAEARRVVAVVHGAQP